MPNVVKDLLLSKKFIVALLACAGSVAAHFGWSVNTETILTVIAPLLVYIGAQGWADNGKEKARIEQTTAMMVHAKMVARVAPAPERNSESGFARVGAMATVAVIGLLVAAASCARVGQVTLRAGQCILDSGVLGDVATALSQPDYVKRIEDIALRAAPDLLDCALQAVASSEPSPAAETRMRQTMVPVDTLSQRAREVIAARKSRR